MLKISLTEQFRAVRQFSTELCSGLSPEDSTIQSMPDASPAKWHLAHTTWFFETFVLKQTPDYAPFDTTFEYLFNSYYNAIGEQYSRAQRGAISRPGLAETYAYREHVDAALVRLLEASADLPPALQSTIVLGLQHEQQHQELILTDIKHGLACNPLHPVFRSTEPTPPQPTAALQWRELEGGLCRIGYEGDAFCFDNERPRHRQFLEPFALASRPVTCGEYLEFIHDDGYRRPELWMSLGWTEVQQQGWKAPLYWTQDDDGGWLLFTLSGRRPVRAAEPVCHVSWFEADAYARWRGARLPTEAEWETAGAAASLDSPQNMAFSDRLLASNQAIHPLPASGDEAPFAQLLGGVWEWTSSSYGPYPGFTPAPGALGEYNGKFMCNQYVLRGGSCATPSSHLRPTYRNFFPPSARWQFSGIRLAR